MPAGANYTPITMLQRIEKHAFPELNSGCWLWDGTWDEDGYGIVTHVPGRSKRAHKIAYEEIVGPVPKGMVLDHICRTRCCVNPEHLEPVTCGENIRRGEAGHKPASHCKKGHAYAEHQIIRKHQRVCGQCLRDKRALRPKKPRVGVKGEAHGAALLTESQVLRIRKMADAGARHVDIAPIFGILPNTVGLIVRRETWRHI